jgi:hypothetical protein
MEAQNKIDKVLRAKLKDFEMAPPPRLFDQISEQINAPVQKRASWYLRPQVQWAAASCAILAVAAAVWLTDMRQRNAPAVSAQRTQLDTFTTELRAKQLQGLELLAEQLVLAQAQKNTQSVQPQAPAPRLVSVAGETVPAATTRETIELMTPRQLQSLKTRAAQMPVMASASTVFEEASQLAETPAGVIPALIKSYGVLSNADLFAIAKEKFEDFKTKEHYVSFNLGALQIGQTIQLSKPENSNEN